MLFCVTFRHLSVQFFGVYTPLTPPSLITQMIRDQNCLSVCLSVCPLAQSIQPKYLPDRISKILWSWMEYNH